MVLFLILLIIAVSGYLIHIDKKRRFYIPQAALLVFSCVVVGSIFFVIGTTLIGVFSSLVITNFKVSSLFLLVLLVAILGGVMLFWLMTLASKWIEFKKEVLMLSEYFIQWSLIYITIYQVIFDSLLPANATQSLVALDIATPEDMVLLILPSLISTWIAVILFKLKRNVLV